MWKRGKRILALLLSAGLCTNGTLVQAAVMPSDSGDLPPAAALLAGDDPIVDFNMDTMNGKAVINQADDRGFDVLGNTPTLVEGKEGHGKALQFDGSTNYINLGQDYQFTTGQVTIAAWVNIDQNPNGLSRITGRGRTAVPNEKELSLYVRKNGTLEAQCPDGQVSSPGAVPLGSWEHIAVTHDGTYQTLYLNGEVLSREKKEAPTEEWNLDMLVGTCLNNAGTGPFNDHMFKGLMDDVKMYNRSLSMDEIQGLADVPSEGGGDEEVTLPDALYEFTMNEISEGTGEFAGKKVIYNHADGTEYPIYGGAKVDDFGIYDKSIMFNGSDTYVNIGRPDINNEFTLSSWFYITAGAANNMNKIFGRDRTGNGQHMFYLAVRADGRAGEVEAALDGGGTGAPAGTVPFGEWVNLTVTNTPEKSCLYMNGELISTGGGSKNNQNDNPMDMLIGCGFNNAGDGIFNGHAFKGRLDDVRIYNVALNEAQVKLSNEGIADKIPPEINSVNPKEGQLISPEGKVEVAYNMAVTAGTEEIQILDPGGNVVPSAAAIEDRDEKIEGAETLVITPDEKLASGKTYTYQIPAGALVNEKGVGNFEKSYSYTVLQDLEGNASESDLEYWAASKLDIPSAIIEKEGKVVLGNGLVERTFDPAQNFLTVGYENLYTGISLMDNSHLQADILLSLNEDYVSDGSTDSDVLCDVGGTDETIPTFQYTGYTTESIEEPFHWEYDDRISPPSMKDTDWPAKGTALVVNYDAPDSIDAKFAGVKLQVRYEIYDGIPAISKIINITNTGDNDVIIHRLTNEVLPIPTSLQDALYVDSDMNMGNNNHDRNNGQYIFKQWEDIDGANGLMISRYAIDLENQVGMHGLDHNNFGPDYRLAKDESFVSNKVYELFHSSSYYEWQTLEVKKMYRVLFPQTQDAPLIYHLISSNPDTVKWGIDQAAEAGFNMVLLSFGSGANAEDISPANIAKYKDLCDYAHSKDILLGAYMMLTARGGGDTHNGIWNTMRCVNSVDSRQTQENTLTFIDQTGLDCLEIDGSYPGSLCEATNHAGHEGIEDSVVKQWETAVRGYYKDLRARNVYINAPDWQYMAGASMGVMGYAESGFSVTPLEQLIYGRSMSYYGTYEKMPAMGWTLVPLSPYGGGGDSSFWPYNDKIMEYDFMIGMNMLTGTIGSYRGGNGLYQDGMSQNVMKTWGDFYEKYRDILGADIVHIAPPLPVDINSNKTKAIDGFMHASPEYAQKGLAAFFNQTGETVTQTVKLPLYFTGLTELKTAPAPVKDSHYRITDPTRTSGPIGHMGANFQDETPPVPVIPDVTAVPTNQKAYVCIGDMNGKEYTIDSNGDVEVEITMEPNTYTWLTVYDPENIPEDVLEGTTVPAPENLSIHALSSSQVTLQWDAIQMGENDVKEYHVYRDGEYVGKTFTNQYTDKTLSADMNYRYEVSAVHNTVAGERSAIEVSTVADTVKPVISTAKATSKTEIQVTFSESVEAESAAEVSNYTVEGKNVTSAVLGTDNRTVTLQVDSALEPFVEITVSAKNIADLSGNVIEDNAQEKVVFGNLRKFSFEETDGNIAVDDVNGMNGTIAGDSVLRKDGVSGQGLSFDGMHTYVDAGDIVKTWNEYAISGWFLPEDIKSVQSVMAQQREAYDGWKWNLTVENSELKFAANNGKGSWPGHDSQDEIIVELSSGAQKVTAGAWNHFSLVRDGDTFTLYLNGEKADSKTQAGIDQSQSLYTMWFGGMRNNAGGEPMNNFKGMMDEIKFYNTPISDEKVKELYGEFQTVDKSLLEKLYNQCKDITQGSCPDAVWQKFVEARNAAEAVLKNSSATAQEVHETWLALFLAKANLEEGVNKELLIYAIELGENVDTTNATPASIERLNDALEAGRSLLDAEVTEEQVKQAVKDIMDAIQNLQDLADKQWLQDLVDTILKLTEANYTPSTWNALMAEKANAEAILANDEATQEQVNAEYKLLAEKMMELKDRANRKGLETAIELAEAILAEKDSYVGTTIKDLAEVLNRARTIAGNLEAEQADVNSMAKELLETVSKARRKADKRSLQAAVLRAQGVETTRYTDDSVKDLQEVLDKAGKMLGDESLSEDDQKKVDTIVAELTKAIDGLKLKADPDKPSKPQNPSGGNQKPSGKPGNSPKTGDETLPFLWMGFVVLAGASGVLFVKKKRDRKQNGQQE